MSFGLSLSQCTLAASGWSYIIIWLIVWLADEGVWRSLEQSIHQALSAISLIFNCLMFFVYFKLPKGKTADEDKPDTAFGHYRHPVSLFSENATESHGLPPMPPWKIQCLWSASSFWLKPHEPARIPQLTAINPMPPRAANPTQQPQLAAPVFTAGALSIQQFVSSMFLGMLPWWIRIRFISLFALIYIILFNEVPLGIPWPFHINGIWRLIWL